MKFLALDVGEKRIGVAVSDKEGIIANPHSTLEVESGLMQKLGRVISKEKPDVIVFGVPRHQNGEEAKMAEEIREFAKGVGHEYNVGIDYEDESVTSKEAEERLKKRKMPTKKIKDLINAEAAAIILEAYIARK